MKCSLYISGRYSFLYLPTVSTVHKQCTNLHTQPIAPLIQYMTKSAKVAPLRALMQFLLLVEHLDCCCVDRNQKALECFL